MEKYLTAIIYLLLTAAFVIIFITIRKK